MKEIEKFCIYRHIRLDTNEVFYIGIGNNKRPYSNNRRSLFWRKIIKKTSYEVQILKSDLTWEDAKELEIILVAFYGRKDLGLGPLCNLTNGGEGTTGWICTSETRSKISKSNLNKSRNKGNHHSLKTKQLMSDKKKGLYKLGNHPKAKKVVNIITNEIFSSVKELSLILNINYGTFKTQLQRNKNLNFKYYE